MYAVIDVETANPKDKGSICSIGVVMVDNGAVVDTFYSLVKPLTQFDPMCMRIHHIKPEHVTDAPTFAELWPKLYQYFKCGTLVAYRASTDIYALEKAAYDAGIELCNFRYADALVIAKKLLRLDSYKLSAVAAYFNIEQANAHNALDDAATTASVMLHLQELAQASTLNQLMRACCLTYEYTDSNNYAPETDKCGKLDGYSVPCACRHGNSDFFQGKSVVLTGTFTRVSREALKLTIAEMGGVCKTQTSRKTDIVVFGFYNMDTLLPGCAVGSKLQNAYNYNAEGCNIVILDENELFEILNS